MKVIITEEQKKKLFVPRDIDKRQKQYLSEIGMDPVIQYLRDNDTSIRFDMSTTPDEWRWDIHDISDDNSSKELWDFDGSIKSLFMNIADGIEGIYHIWGAISVTDDKLNVMYDCEISSLRSGEKTYQL